MNLLKAQEEEISTYMCIADNCQASRIFKKEQRDQHDQHKGEYFDIDKTISKIQNSYLNLIKFKEEEEEYLQRLKEQVKQKEKDIQDLNGTINNTKILTKSLDNKNIVYVRQNRVLLNKLRFEWFDFDQSNLHEQKLMQRAFSLQNNLIDSAPLFVYPDFQAVYKDLPLDQFTKCEIQCQKDQHKTVEYLFLDKYLSLGQRAGCGNCYGAQLKSSLQKSQEFIKEVINQEIMLEKLITLAGNVKKFRNQILKTLKHLINCLDVEIKNVSQKLVERQKNFNLMMPNGGQFSLGNYQYIAEMLSDNMHQGKELENHFTLQEMQQKIDEITSFVSTMNTNYKQFTENDNYSRFFNEKEDKLRLTLEVVRKNGTDQIKIFKGYEILVQRIQKINVLLHWIRAKEQLSIDSVVKISLNYCIFDFDQNAEWKDYNIKNGAIVHVIFE